MEFLNGNKQTVDIDKTKLEIFVITNIIFVIANFLALWNWPLTLTWLSLTTATCNTTCNISQPIIRRFLTGHCIYICEAVCRRYWSRHVFSHHHVPALSISSSNLSPIINGVNKKSRGNLLSSEWTRQCRKIIKHFNCCGDSIGDVCVSERQPRTVWFTQGLMAGRRERESDERAEERVMGDAAKTDGRTTRRTYHRPILISAVFRHKMWPSAGWRKTPRICVGMSREAWRMCRDEAGIVGQQLCAFGFCVGLVEGGGGAATEMQWFIHNTFTAFCSIQGW